VKPWAKYEVNFINHNKFRAITANAIGLWLEGKNYADDKLTDGLLPGYEIKHWRFYSAKCVRLLTTSCGTKPGTADAYFPLWEIVDGFGFKMHDYLIHNDCRDEALERIEQADESRRENAERMRKWRLAKKEKRLANAPVTAPVTVDVTRDRTSQIENVTLLQRSDQNSELRTQKELSLSEREFRDAKTKALGKERRLDPLPPPPPDELADRAARFLERYAELFVKHRRGALYRAQPHLDLDVACDICATWTDDVRLEKLAVLVLTTDDSWIASTDRSFRVFAKKATWADDKLRQWELEHGIAEAV
jgi:hypothetical protein